MNETITNDQVHAFHKANDATIRSWFPVITVTSCNLNGDREPKLVLHVDSDADRKTFIDALAHADDLDPSNCEPGARLTASERVFLTDLRRMPKRFHVLNS